MLGPGSYEAVDEFPNEKIRLRNAPIAIISPVTTTRRKARKYLLSMKEFQTSLSFQEN